MPRGTVEDEVKVHGTCQPESMRLAQVQSPTVQQSSLPARQASCMHATALFGLSPGCPAATRKLATAPEACLLSSY